MERLSNNLNIELDKDLKDYAKELYKNLLDDTELYKELIDEGFSNQEIFDHIGLFSDLKENRDLDKKIKSFDDCIKYNHYYYFKVVRKGINFDKVFYANKFYEEYLKYCGHFIYKDFDNEFNNVKNNKSKKGTITAAQEKLKNNKWIYLTGAFRSGRTYLAIGMCNSFIIKHNSCKVAFINCPKRFAELVDLYFTDKDTYKKLMDSIKNADFVVFDDFGSEFKSASIRDVVVKPILLYRAINNLITVFTSNFDIKEIRKMYEISTKDSNASLNVKELKEVLENKVGNELLVSNLSLY